MLNREEKLIKYIAKWIELNEKMREINKYLYEHTELFEAKRIEDYNEELFAFFAGKITRYTKDYNTLLERMTFKQNMMLKEFQLFGE